MELVLYTIIAWLVAVYLFTSIRKNEVIRSFIIYFIFSILTVSGFTIITLNLHLIDQTTDKSKFLSLLINRNIIIPFMVLISINYFYRLTKYKNIIPVILLIILITLIEYINLKLQIYSYVKWNFGLSFLAYILFVSIALFISKCINVIQLRSVHE